MDRESNRPRGRSGRDAQDLRDIAHLYLSGSRKPTAATQRAASRFCLGVTAAFNHLDKVDLCANLALQFARLGRRTLVVDLDVALPNVGFRLGLSPAAYLRHLEENGRPGVERGPLGVRLLVGVAAKPASLAESTRQELQQAQCVVVNLPASSDGLYAWRALLAQASGRRFDRPPPQAPRPMPTSASAHLQSTDPDTEEERRVPVRTSERRSDRTTMARAGAQSRMFGQWLETAQRRDPAPQESAADLLEVMDALIYVQEAPAAEAMPPGLRAWQAALPEARVHVVQSPQEPSQRPPVQRPGSARLAQGMLPWAVLQAAPPSAALRQPSSLLYPEHESSRLYESLAQSLLASGRQRGVGDVRAS